MVVCFVGMERNFRSYSHDVSDTLKQPYDLKSIMHYGNKAFTKNGGDTIISRRYPGLKLGAKKEKLSLIDHKQLNQLYKCNVRSRRRLGYNCKLSYRFSHKELFYISFDATAYFDTVKKRKPSYYNIFQCIWTVLIKCFLSLITGRYELLCIFIDYCRNVISGCFNYAVNSDACESNYDFMEHYCRRSCGFCW